MSLLKIVGAKKTRDKPMPLSRTRQNFYSHLTYTKQKFKTPTKRKPIRTFAYICVVELTFDKQLLEQLSEDRLKSRMDHSYFKKLGAIQQILYDGIKKYEPRNASASSNIRSIAVNK
eukprot:TRINITY_DN3615_c0_g1_i1.p1 TRINITY_DN3615_c0_g1~~TRINITY_DN3615_c0_g1_i1.p1  ORF type:complete len:137 (-),score=9.94 TRINITY_DN3615_c0_g1_i1:309-659(-)